MASFPQQSPAPKIWPLTISKPDYKDKSMQTLNGSGFYFERCKNFGCGQVLSAPLAARLQLCHGSGGGTPSLNQLHTRLKVVKLQPHAKSGHVISVMLTNFKEKDTECRVWENVQWKERCLEIPILVACKWGIHTGCTENLLDFYQKTTVQTPLHLFTGRQIY